MRCLPSSSRLWCWDLKPPTEPTLKALLPLWPTALSYAVSYLFIAIIWVNHHHLLRFVYTATSQLIWWNFAHLFMISLVPATTVWMAATKLAAAPVFVWNASVYQSILELAEACDVPVRWSCRAGVCHNCESGLVSGAVVYGPEPLEKPPMATFSFAAHNRFATSSSTCDSQRGS